MLYIHLALSLNGKEGILENKMENNSLNKIAWKKLKKDKLAFYSLIFILILSFIGMFPYLLMTDKTEYANEMNLELSTLPPFSKVSVLTIEEEKIFVISYYINLI